jgi:hypothetical protein
MAGGLCLLDVALVRSFLYRRLAFWQIQSGLGFDLSWRHHAERSVRRHSLIDKFFDRLLVLGKMRQPHAAQDVRRLSELDIVIADDLYAVAPGVEEIEKLAG